MIKFTRYLIVLVLALVLSPLALADITGKARVIDGDTLEIDGKRIRLHGIDAPESRQLCRRGGERWRCGKDATSAMKAFLGSRPVSCKELDRDRYRRVVAKCAVDGVDIGEWTSAKSARSSVGSISAMRRSTSAISKRPDLTERS